MTPLPRFWVLEYRNRDEQRCLAICDDLHDASAERDKIINSGDRLLTMKCLPFEEVIRLLDEF